MDEADQMLEIGFKDDMEKIIKAVCSDSESSSGNTHQTLLFSATVALRTATVIILTTTRVPLYQTSHRHQRSLQPP